MNIGIDLDNTIINYDNIFEKAAKNKNLVDENWCGRKENIKKEILKQKNGTLIWQFIQGEVYGDLIKNANLNTGVYQFILRALVNDCKIYIISHKTKYAQHSKKILLRDKSTKYLINKNIIGKINIKNIFYENSRRDKINRINKKNLSWYIDDLSVILKDKRLENKSKKILYQKKSLRKYVDFCTNDWYEISNIIFGPINNIERKRILKLEYNYLGIKTIKNLTRMMSNSDVYELNTKNGKYVAKIYPYENNNNISSRFLNEVNAYNLLEKNSVIEIPKIKTFNKELNTIIFHKIRGDVCKKIDNSQVKEAVHFICKLKDIKDRSNKKITFKAKEACLCISDIHEQINSRFEKLKKLSRENVKIKNHLTDLLEAYKTLISNNNKNKLSAGMLRYKYQILSPSDFGYHNALIKNKKAIWYDFEYLGLDDPSKLIIDFILHPAMKLTVEQKKLWYKLTTTLFSNDLSLKNRINVYWPFFCIRWSLIILLKIKNKDSIYVQLNKSKIAFKNINVPIFK